MLGTDNLADDLEKFRTIYGHDPKYVWVHPEMNFDLKDQVVKNGMGSKMRHHTKAMKDCFVLLSTDDFTIDGE